MPANRTTLDFNFVALVLSVNGRVRPDDLQSIPALQRTQLLQSFHDAYGASEPLHFEGDVLVRGAASAGPDASAAMPAAVVPGSVSTRAAQPGVAAAGAPAPAAAAPSMGALPTPAPAVPDFFGPSAYESVGPATTPATPLAPAVSPGASAGPEPSMSGDFFTIPGPEATEPSSFFDGAGTASGFDAPAPAAPAEPLAPAPAHKASLLFWLLPVVLTFVGGLIAFFAVRGKNARQARAMLITGVVLTVVYALIAYAALALGVFGLGMFASNSNTSLSPASVTAAQPPVATDYPKWTTDKDHGVIVTKHASSKNPAARIRQDHYSELTSPSKNVQIVAWYARSAATAAALRATVWVDPDTLFKGTDGSSKQATSLLSTMTKLHPAEALLGAYPVGGPANGATTYDVGWAVRNNGKITHGEHVFSYSTSSGWTQVSAKSKSTSAWNTTGAFK